MKKQYAFVRFDTVCNVCGVRVEGMSLARFDGFSTDDAGDDVALFEFTTPPQCLNGHELRYYVQRAGVNVEPAA